MTKPKGPTKVKSRQRQLKQKNKTAPKQISEKTLRHARNKFLKKNNIIDLRQRMMLQLKSSRFRYINEQFYSSTSSEAKKHFEKNTDEFEAYHTGYKQQVSQWPANPVDIIIDRISKRIQNGSKNLIIADFGCGDAKIARTLTQATVHSFDLVALNEHVTICDMSETPLGKSSVDIVVFCLSLMGTNMTSFIAEANRVLKEGGMMMVAEIESRFDNVNEFMNNIKQFGFKISDSDLSNDIFYFINFIKISPISKKRKHRLPELTLNPCLYKKR